MNKQRRHRHVTLVLAGWLMFLGFAAVEVAPTHAAQVELSEENVVEVQIPLLGWEEGLKAGRNCPDDPRFPTCDYSICEELPHSGKMSAKISYRPARPGERIDYAFHIPNRYHLTFYRVQPLFGIPQKLSLWIHGDGSGSDFLLYFGSPNSGRTYEVGKIDWTGWREVTIDLTKEADPDGGESSLKDIAVPSSCFRGVDIKVPAGKSGAIYLDDLVLTTRLNKDFPYVFYAENTAEDNIIEEGRETAFRVLVGNYGEEDKVFTVDYALENYWGQTVSRGSHQMSVAAGGKAVEKVRIDQPLPHGWYQARFLLAEGGKTVATVEEPVAVLRRLPKSLFCDENPLGNYGGHTRQGAKVGLSEVYLVRLDDVQKKKGPEAVADWRPSSFNLATMKEHGYTGIVFYLAPAWAYLPEEEMEKKAEKWSEGMAEIASALKGLPIYYKILSEPNNTRIPADRCFEVLKYAAEGLRKGDPEARIIGLNTSKFDWPRQKVVWELGGLKYVHAVGVHPYCNMRFGSHKPERVHGIGNLMCMLRLDDMIRRYNNGRPKKIWASEFGYTNTPGATNYVTWEDQANYVARMVIEYKTMNNFGKLHYHLFKDSAPESGQWGFVTYYNQPKPLAVSFHSLAERMTGARWLKTLEISGHDNIRAYLFKQKDGRQMLVAWSVDGPAPFDLPVRCDSVEVMDLMGVYHSLSAEGGQLSFDLTESPVFIAPAEGHLIADRWVQVLTRFRQVRLGEKDKRLVVKVTNHSARSLEGTLRCHLPADFTVEPVTHPVEVAPAEERDYEFSLSVPAQLSALGVRKPRGYDCMPECQVELFSLGFSLETTERLAQQLADTYAAISLVRR